ncbi:HAD family phosphatase [Asticcacaulis sp. 201]|uniref:HAD family hydrolase n=1 Tax=Asticcacaulis sp. 201 TaxID=3028787 RepID=UPI002915CC1F|nr:HAD family phosphatase [Asticcacaulis sp. 201]MDV6332875.1 HAD family phosphatase [Asticcacaulis sp. 201]
MTSLPALGVPLLDTDVQAIIFDCDGTLADTFGAHYRAFREVLADYKASFEAEFYLARLGLSRYQLLQALTEAQGITFDDADVARRTAEAFNKHLAAIRPIPYTHDILRSQYGRIKLGVASGGQRDIVEATLTAVGVLDRLDTVVTIEDAGVGKPAPDLYLVAADRLGIAPRFIQTYEDSDEGIESATRAGMRVIDIRPYYRTDPANW